MANSVTKGKSTLENQNYYVFMEKWQPRDSKQQCLAGTSHLRLVVGMYQKQGYQTFDARAWDMLIEPDASSSTKKFGAGWEANNERFWTNHYMKQVDEDIDIDEMENNSKYWKKASKENDYEFIGKVKPGIVKEDQTHNPALGLEAINEYLEKQGKIFLTLKNDVLQNWKLKLTNP